MPGILCQLRLVPVMRIAPMVRGELTLSPPAHRRCFPFATNPHHGCQQSQGFWATAIIKGAEFDFLRQEFRLLGDGLGRSPHRLSAQGQLRMIGKHMPVSEHRGLSRWRRSGEVLPRNSRGPRQNFSIRGLTPSYPRRDNS